MGFVSKLGRNDRARASIGCLSSVKLRQTSELCESKSAPSERGHLVDPAEMEGMFDGSVAYIDLAEEHVIGRGPPQTAPPQSRVNLGMRPLHAGLHRESGRGSDRSQRQSHCTLPDEAGSRLSSSHETVTTVSLTWQIRVMEAVISALVKTF